jgi:hypothetical protein
MASFNHTQAKVLEQANRPLLTHRLLITAIVVAALAGCDDSSPPNQAGNGGDQQAYSVICPGDLALPEFTLGPGQKLDEAQTRAICQCINNKIDSGSGWVRETLTKLMTDRADEVAFMHMRAFPTRLGEHIMACDSEVL